MHGLGMCSAPTWFAQIKAPKGGAKLSSCCFQQGKWYLQGPAEIPACLDWPWEVPVSLLQLQQQLLLALFRCKQSRIDSSFEGREQLYVSTLLS